MSTPTDTAVRKTISVRAGVERAFQAFTSGIDDWWPRTHHIGKAPMQRGIIEPREGGRCYTMHTDGSESDWGRVTVWEPPQRFVMAWLINAQWQCETDPAKASEVEVRFTAQADGATRVDLEHRHFERMGEGGTNMRIGVDGPGGWSELLRLYGESVDKGESAGAAQ